MRIAVRPESSELNPYASLFSGALRRRGHQIKPFESDLLRVNARTDVIIFHWPNEFFFRNKVWDTLRVVRSLLKLHVHRLREAKVVWVVHNVLPHRKPGRPATIVRKRFFALLDGLIFLSRSSREHVLAAFPELESKPYLITSHGDYGDLAFKAATLKRPSRGPVSLAYVGLIRGYKAIEPLAEIVARLPPDRVNLSIVGRCKDRALRERLLGISTAAPHVSVDLRFLDAEEFEAHVDRCDAVILPYRNVLNSGSALYALSRLRPVLAPRIGGFQELSDEVGPGWITLYDGDLTRGVVENFVLGLNGQRPERPPNLKRHSWTTIGAEVDGFLRRI